MLFGLPFFLVGAGFLFWSVIPTLYNGWNMQSWPSVSGQLSHANLAVNHSDDSMTWSVEARYNYAVLGRQFSNDRVAINSGGDNIGSFQQDLGRRLEYLHTNHLPVTVFYDPTDPANAVLNRDIRWGLLGFKMIFVLVFGGVGAGMIYWGFRGKRRISVENAADTPWLTRPEWQGGIIKSQARGGMIAIWAFAAIWNLISAPLAFQMTDIWREEGPVALIALLFPLVGLGLLFWAIRLTLEWKRFGVTPLTMDPYPGSIGGDVGGEIRVNIPYQSDMVGKVTLSNIYSYVSGSGKNRSRSERVEWQDEGYARILRYSNAVGLQFRFEVPDGLMESQESAARYYLWRLDVHLEMEGTDLDRSFELPVFKTGGHSRAIKVNSSTDRPAGMPELKATDLLPLTVRGNSMELYYPMLRKPARSLGLLVFGGLFAVVGMFLWGEAAKEGFMLYLMSFVFSLIGWGIVAFAFWSALNSLRVSMDGKTISSTRTLLGIPLSRHQFEYADVLAIDAKEGMKSQTGKRHRIEYSVLARIPGKKIVLAEHLDSASKKNLVVEFFEQQLLDTGSRFEIG